MADKDPNETASNNADAQSLGRFASAAKSATDGVNHFVRAFTEDAPRDVKQGIRGIVAAFKDFFAAPKTAEPTIYDQHGNWVGGDEPVGGERRPNSGSRPRRFQQAGTRATQPAQQAAQQATTQTTPSAEPRHSFASDLLAHAENERLEETRDRDERNRRDNVQHVTQVARGFERAHNWTQQIGNVLHRVGSTLERSSSPRKRELGSLFRSAGEATTSFGNKLFGGGTRVAAGSASMGEAAAGATARGAAVGGAAAMGEGAAAVAGPVGIAVAAAVAVGVEFAKVTKQLHDFGEGLLQAKRAQAEVNGQMAVAFAQLDAERFGRKVQNAAQTADSTAGVAKSQSKLENAMAPYQAAMDNVVNRITEGMQTAVAEILEGLSKIPLFGALVEWLANKKAEVPDLNGNFRQFVDFFDKQSKPQLPPRGRIQ